MPEYTAPSLDNVDFELREYSAPATDAVDLELGHTGDIYISSTGRFKARTLQPYAFALRSFDAGSFQATAFQVHLDLAYASELQEIGSFRARSEGVDVYGGFALRFQQFELQGWIPQLLPPYFAVPRGSARTHRPLLLYDGVAVWDTPVGQ